MSQALDALISAAHIPVEDWPARYPGFRPMGYLCSYVPVEIIHAAGFSPVRVRGNSAPLRYADAHLQSYTCALCRSTLDQMLSGNLRSLAGTVFAHTCDSMQALADLWRMNTTLHFVDVVMQPTHLGTPSARPYLIAELSRFRQRLSAWAGRSAGDGDLEASIAVFDETRRLMQELELKRDRLTAPQFYAVVDAVQSMPREVANDLLSRLIAELDGAPPLSRRPQLFLVGAVLDEPRLLELIEGLGAAVAGDDLCTSSRQFLERVGKQGDPIAALADYYLRRTPCPVKYNPAHDSGRHILERAKKAAADGILFIPQKFCEPHAFDYSMARPWLERQGVPHLLLEMEQVPSLEGMRTRLQAFVELL